MCRPRVGSGSQRFSEITRGVGGANGVRDMTFDLKGRREGVGSPCWLQGRLLTGARRMRAGGQRSPPPDFRAVDSSPGLTSSIPRVRGAASRPPRPNAPAS
ncbi:unnamed protein product [Chrysodeixis includens]|uniref:Uncharacterized protein n=1 Tax=Chrysodeixis includens TaxID=689277 RepID=A0A9N8KST6_CHRIL|nr:unnamed protein product [Chrysodeixis includens]